MRLTIVGSGDAFGSGGRFNTCFHVAVPGASFLVDCGASSLIALKRAGIDRNAIGLIVVTHFHGDHFGGIPYFMLDAQFFSKRTQPLIIAGPEGLAEWYERVMEATFPGSSGARRKFDLELREIRPGEPTRFGAVEVLAARVRHGQPEGPFHAYRISAVGRTLAYTGDSEWTDALIGIEVEGFGAGLHESVEKDGMHMMQPVARLEIPAHGSAELAPGGYHVMITGLDGKSFEAGAKVPAVLIFEKAGRVPVSFAVQKRGEGEAMPGMDHGAMDHGAMGHDMPKAGN